MSCEDPTGGADAVMARRPKYDRSKICVKCKQRTGNIVIRHAVYCRECFVPLITYRFRKALEPHVNERPDGPRRTALKPRGNLLIAYSGGLGSTVLLDLVKRCYVNPDESLVSMEGGRDHPRHERVWKRVTVCYVELCGAFPEMRDRTEDAKATVSACQDIEWLPLRIEDVFDASWWRRVGVQPDVSPLHVDLRDDKLSFTTDSDDDVKKSPIQALRQYLASLPTPTALDSTVKIFVRVLLQYAALMTGSSHLLFGTTLTSLAVSLISGVSQGNGFHVKEETQEEWSPESSFTSGTNDGEREKKARSKRSVRLLRPLREIGRKECAVWCWWMGLKVVGREDWKWPGTKPGIDKLTRDFIFGLEKDYPSTVSTIVKTCAKLVPKGEKAGYCVSCQRPIQYGMQDWKNRIAIRSRDGGSALRTSASEGNSLARYLCYVCHTNLTSKGARPLPPLFEDIKSCDTVVTPVWTSSRIDSLVAPVSLPPDAIPKVATPLTESAMREAVQEYLLDD